MASPADRLPPAPVDRAWPVSPEYVARARIGREILRDDPHRPRYHACAPVGWMNDPNGVLQHDGRWHLFYQHNPRAGVHADMHWGYMSSPDLVHWDDHACALRPEEGTYDAQGIWSGNAVVADDGTPTLFYTGVQAGPNDRHEHQLVCIAHVRDGFTHFEKDPGNPVIASTPAGMDLVQYRDPFVWRGRAGSPNKWLLTIGAGFPGVGGTALVYGSDDLRHWDYLHPMAVGDASVREPVWTGIMWECPDYYEDPTTGKGVLVLSAWDRGVQYVVASTGDVDATGTRLVPTNTFALDGGAFYAPQSFWDAKGRRIQFGWLRESRPATVHGPAGWAGAMSLPRVLRVTPDGRLAGSPAPEVAALRRDHVPVFPSARTRHAVDLHEAHFELSLRFDAVGTGRSGAWVRCSPDGQEATFTGYDPAVGGLIIDRSQSSVDRVNSSTASLTPVVIPGGASFTVRIFGDGSVIEAFIEDEGGCIANIGDRIYPTRQDSLGMSVEGPTFVGGDAWLMADIWRSRT